MKCINDMAAQGDVVFARVDRLPEGAQPLPGTIVAHSETGHHHVAKARSGYSCERFSDPADPLSSYLRIRAKGDEIKESADKAIADIDAVLVEHLRSFDTHETLALACEGEEAIYHVIRQGQMSPQGWVAVVD